MEDSSLTGALLEQRYRVDGLLARGGMSAVYRGLDTRLDRPVAIKVMDARFADDHSFVERFEREARSAAKIHHPNVVAVHDQGLDGEHVYLVMELVDGGTLRDLLTERGALPVPLAMSIMEPVLSALAAAHMAGLIHRDIKPENVLIGRGGVVKVADFGLVRAATGVSTTHASLILGTVTYLPPEQVSSGNATARGDVYSAGIVFYEMLTGAPPYAGAEPLAVAYRHVNEDVPRPSSIVGGIPPMLDELVVRTTRRDPAARPIDGIGFLMDLQRVGATLAVPRVAVPVPEPTVVRPAVPSTPPSPTSAPTPAPEPEAAEELRLDPETTAKVAPVAPPSPVLPPPGATVVRQVPAGFAAAGPSGTRAMLRSDLDRVIESGPPSGAYPQQHQPHPQQHPSGRIPVQPPPGPGRPQEQRPRPGRPPVNKTRRIIVLSVVAVLVLALAGVGTWWFTAGRYTSVPSVDGKDEATATKELRDADLTPQITPVKDNEIAAGLVIRSEPGAGTERLRGDEVRLVVSTGKPVVPDVTPGATVEQAEQAIRDAELSPQRDDGKNQYDEKIAKGTVLRLEPGPGNKLDIGQRVTIVLSRGPAPKPIPDVRGKTRDEAFAELRKAGFEPTDGPAEFSPDVEAGKVVKTNPPAGTKIDAEKPKQVAVVVSNAVTVPDLNGRTLAEASAILSGMNLQVEAGPFTNPNGRVFIQSPGANSKVEPGSKITVYTI